MTTPNIEPHVKKELETRGEATAAGKHYVPYTDIFETAEALIVIMDMPGVSRDSVDVALDKDRITIEGKVDYSSYTDLRALHTEYNVGHFARSFSLSRRIDRDGITAGMQDGVLTVRLPVAEGAQPHRIDVT